MIVALSLLGLARSLAADFDGVEVATVAGKKFGLGKALALAGGQAVVGGALLAGTAGGLEQAKKVVGEALTTAEDLAGLGEENDEPGLGQ